jgi:hypothetical protein
MGEGASDIDHRFGRRTWGHALSFLSILKARISVNCDTDLKKNFVEWR